MDLPEVWLRGPVAGIPPLLQPVAHGLLHCHEEVAEALRGISAEQLVARPGGAASIAYHVRHAIGSLDRLFTYARGRQLSDDQRAYLESERATGRAVSADELVAAFDTAVARALEEIRHTDEGTLLEPRGVGSKQLPSTVLGLLFHAAEHTQRHIGQLVTTVKVVRAAS